MSEPTVTTLKVRRETRRRLDELKVYPRDTVDDILTRLLDHIERERREKADGGVRGAA